VDRSLRGEGEKLVGNILLEEEQLFIVVEWCMITWIYYYYGNDEKQKIS